MKFDPQKPFDNAQGRRHRRSIRLKGYDYSQAGAYFVTIVAWQRERSFGEIVNGEMILNEFGRIVREEWERTTTVRSNVELEAYVITPNHLHGILVFVDDAVVGAIRRRPYENHIAIWIVGRGDGAIQIHCYKTDQWFT